MDSFSVTNTPHIQISTPLKTEQELGTKTVLNNPDVSILNNIDEIQDGAGLSPVLKDDTIILSKYVTNLNKLNESKKELLSEYFFILNNEQKTNFVVQDRIITNKKQIARLLPEEFKQRVLAWAQNYKLFVVIETAERTYNIEQKQQIRSNYVDQAGELIAQVFTDMSWRVILDDIKSSIKTTEIYFYEDKLLRLEKKIKRLAVLAGTTEKSYTIRDINNNIFDLAKRYYTRSFPLNPSSQDFIKQLISEHNQFSVFKIKLS